MERAKKYVPATRSELGTRFDRVLSVYSNAALCQAVQLIRGLRT
jgi:hypothetical protein